MYPYRTNSADYLDYVAAVKTREEILADPDLCGLLENPYIKENMEVALAWRAAKFGDYQDKYNFVEYFLCNGPELDADTILHYRAEAQADPDVMDIAYSYFTDPNVLSEIRETKYGKKKKGDWTDCFKNPCFYLGDFSGVMGSLGDSDNVSDFFKEMGESWARWLEDNGDEVDRRVATQSGQMPPPSRPQPEVSGTVIQPANQMNEEKPDGDVKAISVHSVGNITPQAEVGWGMLGRSIFTDDVAFFNGCKTKFNIMPYMKFGDWFGKSCSIAIDLLDKANTTRMLGDCYRLWSQVRRLRVFSGSDNKYHPITSDQLVSNRMPDGTVRWSFNKSHPVPADATKVIKPEVAEQAKEKLQNSPEFAPSPPASKKKATTPAPAASPAPAATKPNNPITFNPGNNPITLGNLTSTVSSNLTSTMQNTGGGVNIGSNLTSTMYQTGPEVFKGNNLTSSVFNTGDKVHNTFG